MTPCLAGRGYVRHWIDGRSLATQLRTQGPDTVETAMTRLRSLGSCLVMLHEKGETHGALNGEGAWMTRVGEHYLLGWQWALRQLHCPRQAADAAVGGDGARVAPGHRPMRDDGGRRRRRPTSSSSAR
ncbi:MAG: hypothetical protein IPK33_06380 [Gemmatimonadetes bacterium]|nr:hypothetical protein [Gemmatimonadota bacterium]